MYAVYLHHPLSIRYFFSLVAVVHASVSLGYLGVSLWPQQGVAASLALAVPHIIFSPLLYDRSQVPVHAPPPTQPDFTAADRPRDHALCNAAAGSAVVDPSPEHRLPRRDRHHGRPMPARR